MEGLQYKNSEKCFVTINFLFFLSNKTMAPKLKAKGKRPEYQKVKKERVSKSNALKLRKQLIEREKEKASLVGSSSVDRLHHAPSSPPPPSPSPLPKRAIFSRKMIQKRMQERFKKFANKKRRIQDLNLAFRKDGIHYIKWFIDSFGFFGQPKHYLVDPVLLPSISCNCVKKYQMVDLFMLHGKKGATHFSKFTLISF